jgi:agmatinase
MKSASLLSLLLCAGLSAACGGHDDDDKVWTKEELHELEMKWGTDVTILTLIQHFGTYS